MYKHNRHVSDRYHTAAFIVVLVAVILCSVWSFSYIYHYIQSEANAAVERERVRQSQISENPSMYASVLRCGLNHSSSSSYSSTVYFDEVGFVSCLNKSQYDVEAK